MNSDDLRDALRRDAELAGLPPTDLVRRVAGLRRRRSRRRAGAGGCVVAIAAAVVGVSALDGVRERDGDGDGGSAAAAVDLGGAVDAEAAAATFRETISGAGATGSRLVAPTSLIEFLPNMQYRSLAPGGGLFTMSDAVVVGHVTSVSPGHAHYWPADAEDRPPVEVPFDDPAAVSRTIHVEVAVTEVVAGRTTEDTITVGFGWGTRTPFDVAAEGLPAMGDLLLFLEEGSPVFANDSTVQYSVVEDGAMLAEIESGGRLAFPAIEPYRVERFLSQNPTLDSLRAPAQLPARVLPFATLED